MIYDFILWWTAQIRDLLPPSWRKDSAMDADALVAELGNDPGQMPPVLIVSLRRNHQSVPLGRFPLDAAGSAALRDVIRTSNRPAITCLCLASGLLLEKRLSLPLAAEVDLDRAILYEMDRATPFAADEVWWSAAILRRDPSQGTLDIRLSLVPREDVAPLLAHLAEVDLRPTGLDIPTIEGERRWLPLEAPPIRRRLAMVPVAVGACLLLAVVAAGLPFLRLALAEADLDTRIDALTPEVDQVKALRRKISGSGTGIDALAQERARRGDALEILALVTDALPDDTYLSDLILHQRQLSMTGRSADAAKLIGGLAAVAAFKDPAFSAPVTRVKETGIDLFSVKTEVRP